MVGACVFPGLAPEGEVGRHMKLLIRIADVTTTFLVDGFLLTLTAEDYTAITMVVVDGERE